MMKVSSLTLAAILQGCVDARILGQRDSNSTFNVLDYVDPLVEVVVWTPGVGEYGEVSQ